MELAHWQSLRDGYAEMVQLAQGPGGFDSNEIMLRAGELVVAKVTSASLVEDRRGRGTYSGGSHGVSIPVGSLGGRTVRYRVGQTRGHYVQGEPVPTAIDSGNVFITNMRVIFQGAKQTRECLFAKLIGVEHDDQAGTTVISVSNRQKPTTIHYGPSIAGCSTSGWTSRSRSSSRPFPSSSRVSRPSSRGSSSPNRSNRPSLRHRVDIEVSLCGVDLRHRQPRIDGRVSNSLAVSSILTHWDAK